ncbi:MAG: hypothetical protein ABSE79_12365 [Terriglobia bacterium]|jgi:hypothetical protein
MPKGPLKNAIKKVTAFKVPSNPHYVANLTARKLLASIERKTPASGTAAVIDT